MYHKLAFSYIHNILEIDVRILKWPFRMTRISVVPNPNYSTFGPTQCTFIDRTTLRGAGDPNPATSF